MRHSRYNEKTRVFETVTVTLQDLEGIFGSTDIAEVIADKLEEEARNNAYLKQLYEAKKIAMIRQLTGWYQYLRLRDLELTLGKRVEKSNKILKSYSIQYLKTRKKLSTPKDSFTEYQIQDARDYPIENLITEKIKVFGTRKIARCPFHEERTPSFVIYKTNSFHCFGCGIHGKNAIDFLMKKNGVDFKDAVKSLI